MASVDKMNCLRLIFAVTSLALLPAIQLHAKPYDFRTLAGIYKGSIRITSADSRFNGVGNVRILVGSTGGGGVGSVYISGHVTTLTSTLRLSSDYNLHKHKNVHMSNFSMGLMDTILLPFIPSFSAPARDYSRNPKQLDIRASGLVPTIGAAPGQPEPDPTSFTMQTKFNFVGSKTIFRDLVVHSLFQVSGYAPIYVEIRSREKVGL